MDDQVPTRRVRYAWADNPEGANLYKAAGLPASPFEMDVGQD
jgi:sialate O-acetylesterase